jgi:TonB family protein
MEMISSCSQRSMTRAVILVSVLAFSWRVAAQDVKPLPQPASPGTAIKAATEAAGRDRKLGALDILTDTEGVDFGPYLSGFLGRVRKQWYALIPESVQTKKGRLAIEFRVQPNGQVSEMRLVATSGDVALDRPAWDSIRTLNPFPQLPQAFHGPYLDLRYRFYYNPDKTYFTDNVWPKIGDQIQHAVLIQKVADSHIPEYPRTALDANVDGVVRLEASVATNGRVNSVKAIEGDASLADSAMRAIKQWRFNAARKDGKKVEDLVRINVEFRTEGQRVRTQVVWPEAPSAAHSPE